MQDTDPKSCEIVLGTLNSGSDVFGPKFMSIYGSRRWTPTEADRGAAHEMHVQLVSRIATQRLGYGDGVVARALKSLVELFDHARKINTAYPDGSLFETTVWHVLNDRLRPFTAKWHARAEANLLDALDASDEFRAELDDLRIDLTALDKALCLIRNVDGYVPGPGDDDAPPIPDPSEILARWRPMGMDLDREGQGMMARFAQAEREAVGSRRAYYDEASDPDWAAGIALSGGGIRSASFSIGVLTSLAKRNVLPRFDYLSTVSGGGYAGAFLTQMLGGSASNDDYSLRSNDLPFRRKEGESDILRRLRQNASYLTAGVVERANLALGYAAGIFVNLIALSVLAALVGYLDHVAWANFTTEFDTWIVGVCGIVLALAALGRPIASEWRNLAAFGQLTSGLAAVVLMLQLLRAGSHMLHDAWRPLSASPSTAPGFDMGGLIGGSVGAVVLISLIAGVFGFRGKARPPALTLLVVVLFAVLENLAFDLSRVLGSGGFLLIPLIATIALAYLLLLLRDVDATSLHGYYRRKLQAAFLLEPGDQTPKPLHMSEIDPRKSLFPIVNCAVNLPGSRSPSMRGRNADVFAITPVATGASVLGYQCTKEWERTNARLDIADAMALSGSAVSPQSGTTTTRYASFWLTLLNLRLGAWLQRPDKTKNSSRPGIAYLVREAIATADESLPFVHISDGGHIENLGVYELLKRRCRYIVAIDGENDPKMTFHGLTNLQRLAYIDFGIVLELDLDDLRIGATGYSRSHFRFCRIIYPKGNDDAEAEIGYLAYVKLSLTGNEGEFLRRVRLDEPEFPHHSTADQFFSETRFEAYRALGEHVGEKMFLPAIVGQIGIDVAIDDWFDKLNASFLDRRSGRQDGGAAAAP